MFAIVPFAAHAAADMSALRTTLSNEYDAVVRTGCVPAIASCIAPICFLYTSCGIKPGTEPCCASATPVATGEISIVIYRLVDEDP